MSAALGFLSVAVLSFLTERRNGYTLRGDYRFDADPSLLLGINGGWLHMYSTDPPPLMLPLALIVRLPALLVADHLGLAGTLPERFDIGVAASAAVGVGVVLAAAARDRWRWRIAAALLAAMAVLNPLSVEAMQWGHPEETFGALLLAGGLLFAGRGRWTHAVICVALSGAVKQPFLFAAPTLLFMLPHGQRLRLVAIGAATWLLAVVPFIAADASTLVTSNTAMAGAVGAKDTTYSIQLWYALDLHAYSYLGKPLAALVAVVAPVAVAARNGWKLPVGRGAALLVIVMLWRCVLDPYNIGYYMAPAAVLLICLDWVAWQSPRHPRRRVRWLQNAPPIPVLGLLAAIALHQTVAGWWIAQAWQNLLGHTGGKDYIIDIVLATVGLAWVAAGAPLNLTLARKRLYALAGGLVMTMLVVAVTLSALRPDVHVPHAPAGFKIIPTGSLMQRDLDGLTPYWLGPALPSGEGVDYIAVPEAIKPGDLTRVMVQYMPVDDVGGSVGVFTRKSPAPDIARRDAEAMRDCLRGLCPQGVRLVKTPIGPAMLIGGQANFWEAMVPVDGGGSVYVLSQTKIDPHATLKLLRPLRQD